jgi:hypothetical protein
MSAEPPHFARQSITVRIECECGEVAKRTLTLDQARTWALAILAAVDGIPHAAVGLIGNDGELHAWPIEGGARGQG